MLKRIDFDPGKYPWLTDSTIPTIQERLVDSLVQNLVEQKDEIFRQRLIAFGIIKPEATRLELEDATRKCTREIYPECEKIYYSNGTARVRIIFIDTRIDLNMDWLDNTKTNKYTITGFRYL